MLAPGCQSETTAEQRVRAAIVKTAGSEWRRAEKEDDGRAEKQTELDGESKWGKASPETCSIRRACRERALDAAPLNPAGWRSKGARSGAAGIVLPLLLMHLSGLSSSIFFVCVLYFSR